MKVKKEQSKDTDFYDFERCAGTSTLTGVKIVYRAIIFAVTTIAFCLFAGSVSAVEKNQVKPFVRVSPVILNIILSPGKTYVYNIKVDNLLTTPLPVRAALDRFEPTDEDPTEITESPLLDWVTYDPKDMIIPAGEQRVINLTVNIPDKVPVGGYYGTLFLEPVLPQQNGLQERSVQAKISVLLLANIGVPEATHQAEITQFSLNKFLYQQEPIEVTFKTKNLSLYHFSAKPFITIKPLFGKAVTQEVEEKIILPGKSRTWNKEIKLPDYWHIFYTATLAVSVGNGRQIYKTAYLIGLPGNSLLIIIAAVLLLFLISRRKNIGKFFRALFSS